MRMLTYTEALREALAEEMARDKTVFLLGEDIGAYGGAFGVTRGLLEKYGSQRVIDTPISEQGFVGAAIGAALTGCRPVVEIMFMDFITLALDQVMNMATKLRYVFGSQAKCPLVIRTPAGGGRCYGPTHSQSLEALFMHCPGLKIMAPSSPRDAKVLMKMAIRDDNPVLFIEHKLLYGQRGAVPKTLAAGSDLAQTRILRKGTDVTVVAWSWMTVEALAAAEQLLEQGIDTEIIDLRSLKPLDSEPIIESVKKTGHLVIVEEGYKTCGISAEIGFQVFEKVYDYLDAPIKRVCTEDIPIPASPLLEKALLPSVERIVETVTDLMP